MSDFKKLNQELDELFIANDIPTSNEKKTDWLRRTFEFELQTFIRGEAWRLDRPADWLAFDAIEHLEALLRRGESTKEMQIMLANYLAKYVINRNKKEFDAIEHQEHLEALLRRGEATKEMQIMLANYLAKHVINQNEKVAWGILGIPKGGGRTTKILQRVRAINAYELHIGAGQTDELALDEAWQAHYPDKDIIEEQHKQANDDGKTPYKWQVKNTIKPLLLDAKVRESAKAGCPKKPQKT